MYFAHLGSQLVLELDHASQHVSSLLHCADDVANGKGDVLNAGVG